MARYANVGSGAENMLIGNTSFGPLRAQNRGVKGVPFITLTRVNLGAPAAGVADLLVDDATSTELPNTETVTYTTATDGTSPLDKTGRPSVASVNYAGQPASVWTLDVPRNLSAVATHATSVVAMTITITGYDVYMQKVVETLSITATGTSKTAAGKKAFKHVQSIAITAAADAEANTLTLGTGNVLGLPYRLKELKDLKYFYATDTDERASVTAVAGVTSAATATTGDVRGTIVPNTTPDGAVVFVAEYYVQQDSGRGAAGVAQYAG